MLKRVIPALLAVVLAAACLPAAPPPIPSDAEIRKILVDRTDVQKQGVGIVVGVIEPSGRRRIVAYGSTDRDDKGPLDGDTVFEIGSVTKVFTSLLLADAVRRGEVALDDPVAKYLPAGTKVPAHGGKPIRLVDLATHTAALPSFPPNHVPKDLHNPYADYTVAQLYEFLAGYELPRDPGAQYDYSNLGVGLLGHALARRAGMDYETLVRTRITAPLSMKSTSIALSDSMRKRLATGHDARRERTPNWDLPTLSGAGALRSTANDLLTFLSANLGLTPTPLAPAMASMLATRRPTPRPHLQVALAWHIITADDGRELVLHNGGTGGYRSFVGFDPKNRTGVVVLSNTSTDDGVDDIGRHLLDPSTPLAQPPKQVDPKVLERYVGLYELAPNAIFRITRDGSHLYAQLTGQPKLELFPESETKFFYKVVDAQITFDGDGLVLHQNGDHRAKRIEGSPAAPRERKEISVDPAVLERYVGKYQLSPTFAITVTREGKQLFAQATAQPRFEIFPETERDFFLKAVDAQLTFVTDATGRVTKAILHQGGFDQEAKRVE
ncbi:MAG TPA: serine hydrolase [Thermoanaerobaculia bacterium]|nr:serine hydrolase [Thermoanaerobaculia bacterium]